MSELLGLLLIFGGLGFLALAVYSWTWMISGTVQSGKAVITEVRASIADERARRADAEGNRIRAERSDPEATINSFNEGAAAYRQAAEQGDAHAQFSLGSMYMDGLGVTPDHTEGVKWYRKAADQGLPDAQYALAALYNILGEYSDAVHWYRKAGEQGVVAAQSILGFMYLNGHGVLEDYSEAAYWYRKAAHRGDTEALATLGFLYEDGMGVPQNSMEAHKWYNLAATLIPSPPELETDKRNLALALNGRNKVASKMTAVEVAEAQKLAREWKPK